MVSLTKPFKYHWLNVNDYLPSVGETLEIKWLGVERRRVRGEWPVVMLSSSGPGPGQVKVRCRAGKGQEWSGMVSAEV